MSLWQNKLLSETVPFGIVPENHRGIMGFAVKIIVLRRRYKWHGTLSHYARVVYYYTSMGQGFLYIDKLEFLLVNQVPAGGGLFISEQDHTRICMLIIVYRL